MRLGGEWRALSGKSLLRAKSMAAVALHGSSLPALTALGAALGGTSDLRGLGVSVAAPVGSELEQLAHQLSSPELHAPAVAGEGFHGTLRPYQNVGLGWLLRMRQFGLGALLADDMGLGKTVQLIAYLRRRAAGGRRPALIVARPRCWATGHGSCTGSLPISMCTSTTAPTAPEVEALPGTTWS